MAWVAVGTGVASLVGSWMGNRASQKAASSQMGFQQKALDWQKEQYAQDTGNLTDFQNLVSEMTGSYREAGEGAVNQQQALAGLLGNDAQQEAYTQIENQPGFQSNVRMGEEAILANASATGGVRGGNVQGALAQFRPQMLQQQIDQRYGQLSGLANTGLQATQMRASVPFSVQSPNMAQTYQGMGQIQAGGNLAQGKSNQEMIAAMSKMFSSIMGQQGTAQ